MSNCWKPHSEWLIAVMGLIAIGVAVSAAAEGIKLPSREILHKQAVEESLSPIHPGVLGKVPFWNRYSLQFMYAPAFDFKNVSGAEKYRFTVHSVALGKDFTFLSANPWDALSPIWRDIPVGYVTLKVVGVNGQGEEVGVAGSREFYRAAEFRGPYGKPKLEYHASARLALESLYRQKYVQNWKGGGKPDHSTNKLYSYPSKIVGGVFGSMVIYSALTTGKESSDALDIAKIAAKYLIGTSEPAGSPYEFFPPSYGGGYFLPKLVGRIMTIEASRTAVSYLDLYDATKDDMFFRAATDIADTYVKNQTEEGTWSLMVDAKSGKPVTPNLCLPVENLMLFDRLIQQYHLERFQNARDKCFRWLMDNPMRTYNWSGQFEDQTMGAVEYHNLTEHDAVLMGIYLFEHHKENRSYVKWAEELIRFGEDQFVVWEQPLNANPDGGKKIRNSENWLPYPCVLEQYHYYVPICASASKMIVGFTKAYEVTGNTLYLAKACSLANSLTLVQMDEGPNAGLYLTAWGIEARKQWNKPFEYYWVNCLMRDVRAMLFLGDALCNEGIKMD
jgi:hypothetical protein